MNAPSPARCWMVAAPVLKLGAVVYWSRCSVLTCRFISEALPYESLPVVASAAACSAAFWLGERQLAECDAIAIAPFAMPAAMNGTDMIIYPASAPTSWLTAAMPETVAAVITPLAPHDESNSCPRAERKLVVSGTSGQVSVDLGARRITKKK